MPPRPFHPALRRALLAWFDVAARDLPWRRSKDPYAIWVSEVMLQQTQVATVLGYWGVFLTRFPDVRALAEASLDEVLGHWKGLGYYARARNLHRAAQAVVADHAGVLPGELEALRTLPGFGRYTAGAVASIAFGVSAPIVDGNVARVLARLFLVRGASGEKQREAKLWKLAEALVRGPRPGDFNQSLMELGATICAPRAPTCGQCPVRKHCAALARGEVDSIPTARVRAPRKALHLAVALCREGSRTLLARRPDRGLFGGLWELPSAPATARRHGLSEVLGDEARLGRPIATVERTLTHRDLKLDVYRARLPADFQGPKGYVDWRWASPTEVKKLGMSAAMEAALRAAAEAA